jgi:type I restriction enzyme, S subunit
MSLPERALSVALRLATETVAVETDHEYPVAGIYSFGRGLIRRPTIRGSETAYTKLTRLRAGQFVMSKLNGWEGALTVVPGEFGDSYVSPEYPVFDIDTEVADPGYIGYLAKWPSLWGRLTPRGSMVRRKRIVPATLLVTTVPLPDLPEQRRIAARLDGTMSKLGTVSIKVGEAETLRSTVLESMLDAEQDQRKVRLSDVLTLERIPVEPDPGRHYVQIGIRSFGKGIFHRDKVPGNELSKLRYFEIHPNRLIVSNIMAWEGAIAVSAESESGSVGSSRFLSYSRSGEVDLRYLNYYFQSNAGRALIRTTSTGTVVRNQTLSIKDFENLMVPLPSLERQRKLADLLDTANRIGELSAQQTKTVSDLREALISAAFAGKL